MLIHTSRRRSLVAIPVLAFATACGGVNMPSYEPRPVAVPADCDGLIQRAAEEEAPALSDADSRRVEFCQHQQMLRAAEEEAAARRLDAHARAAGVGLQIVTIVVGTTIAVLAWAL